MNARPRDTATSVTLYGYQDLEIAREFPGVTVAMVNGYWVARGDEKTIDALIDAFVASEPSDAWLRAHGH